MSSRRRGIVGPQSALTDYLASHNISAARIAADAAARRAAAGQDDQQEDQENDVAESTAEPDAAAAPDSDDAADTAERKRKREEQQRTIEKIKKSRAFKRRKKIATGDDSEDDRIAKAIFESTRRPLPGQMENCARCSKRFTVTPYSRADPDGGLLCNPCGKELDADDDGSKKKKKKKPRVSNGPVGSRRKMQSAILDGTFHLGAKNLVTLCVEHLAKNIELAEGLGDLPDNVVDKVARILSKTRLYNPETLKLFLQASAADSIRIYDGARLSAGDFKSVFQSLPNLKHLKVKNAIHFKDEVMEYLRTRNINLETIYLHGANLLSDDALSLYLTDKGDYLKSLRLYYTDKHVTNSMMKSIAEACESLQRLKICHNQQVSGEGIEHIGKLKNLHHLSLHLQQTVHPDAYVGLVSRIGKNLRTLSLAVVPNADNTILGAIHTHCRTLKKLRITESEEFTDDGFVRLFSGWANPPLEFIDFEKCRQLDSTHPRDNPDKIGLCSKGFRALMTHSGKNLQRLNLHACRHISSDAFEEVFGPDKEYPELTHLEISFCEEVTDFVVGSIFRSCPNMREVNVFGCMKVKDVRVPRGKILVGVPTASGMHIEGVHDDDD